MRDSELGTSTAGVWTTAAARAAGLSRSQIATRLADGRWQRVRRGAYADGGVIPDALMRASAAVQVTAGVAAGRTAARVHGLPLVDDDDPATGRFELPYDDVAVRQDRRHRVTLQTARLQVALADVQVLRGVPVLTPLRTLVDLARVLRPDALVCAFDAALHRGLVQRVELERAVENRRWRTGGPVLRTALALADGRAESPQETLARLLFLPVLPGLVPQVVVLDHVFRPVARLDLGDERIRLGVEADGATWHAGRAAQDRRRDFRTGWTIERCTWWEVRREPTALLARVLATARRLDPAA